MIEPGKLYAFIGTWSPRWPKPLYPSSSGMAYSPLLAAVDQYDSDMSGSSEDSPTFALDYIDRSTVEKRLLRKLDLRVAFLVLVYIINYVSWCT
jgi:hypothetical protein